MKKCKYHKPKGQAESLTIQITGGQVTRDKVLALSRNILINRVLTPKEQKGACDPEICTMEITNSKERDHGS
ncbi:unnamed protein product [Urochloa humidicola]